jgi:hypothetical protein
MHLDIANGEFFGPYGVEPARALDPPQATITLVASASAHPRPIGERNAIARVDSRGAVTTA